MAANDIRLPRMHACLAKAIAAVSSIALASGLICGTAAPVFAEDIDTDPTPDELQQEIERTAAELEAAEAHANEIAESLAANSVKLAELEAQIPAQQARSDAAARELYKTQQQSFGIVEVILSSESLGDFLSNVEYVNHVTETNLQEIKRLKAMEAELEETHAALEQEQADAEKTKADAEAALVAAQEARAEAQRKAEEEARRQAEQAAAAAAAAAKAEAERANAEAAARAEAEGEEAPEPVAVPTSEEIAEAAVEASDAAAEATSDGADWSADKESFVAEWATRIDAYLAGSPLAGYGSTFASAAWDNGVDPRWSPAISCVESGKGANCFASCNAWGWGSVSWGSWEEAIYDHVQGLARGYGYTVTQEAAAKYCPPNAEHWYNRCLEEMALI